MIGWCEKCSSLVESMQEACPLCGQRSVGLGNPYFVSEQECGAPAFPSIPPGAVLGERFRIEAEVNRGRFGVVFRARDILTSSDVAIKAAVMSSPDDLNNANHLVRQARLLMKAEDHRHVLKIHGVHTADWEERKLLLVSMELAARTLRDWLNENAKAPIVRRREGLEYAIQMCHGLVVLIRMRILSTDIKPENVFFVNGRVKVGDPCVADEADVPYGEASERSSVSGGTREYMAPEQFDPSRFGPVDERSIVYSIGVILSEIADEDGNRPFSGPPERLRELHISAQPAKPLGAGERIGNIIARCLSKDKKDRYQTVQELADVLEGLGREGSMDNEAHIKWEENRDDLATLWDEACRAESEGELARASRSLDELIRRSPGHIQAVNKRKEIQSRYIRAEELYGAMQRDWDVLGMDELLHLMQEAIAAYPDHPAGKTLLDRMEIRAARLRKIMAQCAKALAQRDWPGAAECLQEFLRLDPGEPCMRRALSLIQTTLEDRAAKRREIDSALIRGDFANAAAIAACLDRNMLDLETEIRTLNWE